MNTKNKLGADAIVFRKPNKGDGKYFWEIAKASKTLDVNSTYHYLIMCRHFGDTCIVAEKNGKIIGFVVGYIPPESPDTIFVWQVAVDEKERGRGIGIDLLVNVFMNTKAFGVTYLDATITPSNKASVNLFTAAAKKLNAPHEYGADFFSPEDFGQTEHEPELLFHIGPVVTL